MNLKIVDMKQRYSNGHDDRLREEIFKVISLIVKDNKIDVCQKKVAGFYISEFFLKGTSNVAIKSNGVSKNKKDSLLLAAYEFVERYVGSINYSDQLLKKSNMVLLGQQGNNKVKVNSNGLSIGRSESEAEVFGLLELIERDTFLNYWYSKKVPYRITNKIEDDLIERLNRLGYSVNLFYLENEFEVNVVWCLLQAKTENATFCNYTTTGCSFSIIDAIKSALKEAFYGVVTYQNKKEITRIGKHCLKNGVNSISDHPCLYALPELKDRFVYLKRCPTWEVQEEKLRVVTKTTRDWLFQMKKYFQNKDWTLIFYELENKEVRDYGFYVKKAQSPDLQPLVFGKQSKVYLNKNRLKMISKEIPEKTYIHPYT